jgi:hypothetical protein
LAWLAEPHSFARFLHLLHQHPWVVDVRKPFGGPEHVLHYLARYTHRVAISNHRLIGMQDGQVTFRWKDYAHGGKKRKMTLAAEEFIRRFLLHVLPKGLVRIRHFGWMANRCRGVAAHFAGARRLEACDRSINLPTAETIATIANTSTMPMGVITMAGIHSVFHGRNIMNAT